MGLIQNTTDATLVLALTKAIEVVPHRQKGLRRPGLLRLLLLQGSHAAIILLLLLPAQRVCAFMCSNDFETL